MTITKAYKIIWVNNVLDAESYTINYDTYYHGSINLLMLPGSHHKLLQRTPASCNHNLYMFAWTDKLSWRQELYKEYKHTTWVVRFKIINLR